MSHFAPRYTVHPVAFAAALVLAPVVVTAVTFWTLIGLFAPYFGVVPYLLIGTPILLWAAGRVLPGFWRYAALGFVANLIPFAALMLIGMLAHSNERMIENLTFIFGFGLLFGPLWAGAFGMLYRTFHPNMRTLRS